MPLHVLGKRDLRPCAHEVVPRALDLEIDIAVQIIREKARRQLAGQGKAGDAQRLDLGLGQHWRRPAEKALRKRAEHIGVHADLCKVSAVLVGIVCRKADGIAEIMTMAECLLRQDIPHGKVCIAFTPDEEIGRGPDDFDVPGFGADFAYTVDGDVEGSIEYQNFNAAAAVFRIRGVNVHPGSAKDVMINAALVAMDINSRLPAADIPARTDGYEGFFHLTDMEGTVESAELKYIIRDHDAAGFDARLALLRRIADDINASLGDGTVTLTIREQYRNMAEKIQPHMHLIRNAERAAHSVGAEPAVHPIRGGTDGARLSFMGLPCPNLGTGGYAFHGPYEHITVEGMDTETAILLELVRLYADQAGDAD